VKIIFESQEERRAFEILTEALYKVDRNSSYRPLDQVQWQKQIMDADKLEDEVFKLEEEIDRICYQMMELPEGEGDGPTPEYLALEEKYEELEKRKEKLEWELKVWELAEEWALYPERWIEWWGQEQETEVLASPGSK